MLLDRQRPGQPEQVRPALELEARPPAHAVRRGRRAPRAGLAASRPNGAREEGEHDRHDGRHEDERRVEPPQAADVEAAQVEAAGRAVLAQQQRGDEEAAEDEEEVDADEAAGQPGQLLRAGDVVGEHQRDGDGAQAVELRQVRGPAGGRRGGREPGGGALVSRVGAVTTSRCPSGPADMPVHDGLVTSVTASSSQAEDVPGQAQHQRADDDEEDPSHPGAAAPQRQPRAELAAEQVATRHRRAERPQHVPARGEQQQRRQVRHRVDDLGGGAGVQERQPDGADEQEHQEAARARARRARRRSRCRRRRARRPRAARRARSRSRSTSPSDGRAQRVREHRHERDEHDRLEHVAVDRGRQQRAGARADEGRDRHRRPPCAGRRRCGGCR